MSDIKILGAVNETSVVLGSLLSAASVAAAPIDPPGPKPADSWYKSLLEPGQRKVYRGQELTTIGMPCGGIAAGQLYVRGDGTLAQWWVFNNAPNTGYGDKCYLTYRPNAPYAQGFTLRVKPHNADPIVRSLSQDDFDAIEFIGEYPIAEIHYKTRDKAPLPVEVSSEVFSPFIPLNSRDSAMPVTVIRFTVKNTSPVPADVSIAGHLQNSICIDRAGNSKYLSRNTVVRDAKSTSVRMKLIEAPPTQPAEARRVIVFEDFESGTYSNWTATGDAFGATPATGKSPSQNPVAGWQGKYFINTFRPDDRPQGTLTSKPFKITEPYLCFLIGGGRHASRTCMNLLVDGKIVRTALGQDNEQLAPDFWDISEFVGREAKIEIVDKESGGWGHINVDYIHFSNLPPEKFTAILPNDPHRGDLSLTALDPVATATAAWTSQDAFLADLTRQGKLTGPDAVSFPIGAKRCGAVASSLTLAPGQSQSFTFLLSWFIPHRPNVGQMYANWFDDSLDVAHYVAQNFQRLDRDTHLFRDTYFDTTLPYWLAARLAMPVSILATETCQWWKNGRFYAWEGVGCCHGTCTHVWNYEHACARLFPDLSRSTRLMQDLGEGFDNNTGLVGFRGDRNYAADGQCGSILKLYREHLMSPDRSFLNTIWPKTKKAFEFLQKHDANDDGIIEDTQHNTFDINFEGPNTFVGSLYLAALRAGEEMARLQGETELASRFHAMVEKGCAFTMQKLWNGEYFTQIVPPGKSQQFQYGTGCLSDQAFGQGWAHQLNLGYIYPEKDVKTALASVFKYNWTSDVGPYNAAFPPERWFARPGDAGLFICTWPKGQRFSEPVRYRDEVWTGIEYQVASHMLYEGMITEGLAIIRGIHDRYDGTHHNPWNEVECGDHYARAMASWGCLLGIEGFIYDGPANKIGFAPRLTPDDFKAFFSSAQAWGHLIQKRSPNQQINRFEVQWGTLRAQTLVFQLPQDVKPRSAQLTLAGRVLPAQLTQTGPTVTLTLPALLTAAPNQPLESTFTW
ncbi:MAG TPA: GH116 family glycosyl hydrolase [Tepidisphaeraceae bacterium]|nr:GH116 family glycosyl hydrolase [Tepidisphaeraceae bacterium]